MNKEHIIECCVETWDESINAEKRGADRLELCSSLDQEGLTPDIALVREVLSRVSIPVKVMIRCRPGDFYYNDIELENMLAEVSKFKNTGVAGFVFGALKNDGGIINLDFEKIRKIAEKSFPLPLTLHKCIDLCSDILAETEKVCRSGTIQSILSSGTGSTAAEGITVLTQMHKICNRFGVELIAAGKITQANLPLLLSVCSISSFHGRKII